MIAPGSRFVVLLVAFAWLIAPGAASAQAPVGNLVANLTIPGTIGLVSYAPSGSTAAYSERVGSRLVPLGTQCHRGAPQGDGLVRRHQLALRPTGAPLPGEHHAARRHARRGQGLGADTVLPQPAGGVGAHPHASGPQGQGHRAGQLPDRGLSRPRLCRRAPRALRVPDPFAAAGPDPRQRHLRAAPPRLVAAAGPGGRLQGRPAAGRRPRAGAAPGRPAATPAADHGRLDDPGG